MPEKYAWSLTLCRVDVGFTLGRVATPAGDGVEWPKSQSR